MESNPRTPYKAVLVLPLRQPGYLRRRFTIIIITIAIIVILTVIMIR